MRVLRRSSSILGLLVVMLTAGCNSNSEHPAASVPAGPEPEIPAVISYDVVKEYPHDPTAFTEGLEYKDGFLYESVGEYGTSGIRKVDLTTGKVVAAHNMEPRYFGEGLTILGDKIYQLTYREGKGFVYDLKTLRQERTFSFPAAEGWGMTNNGRQLIFDAGANTIHFLDPASFKEVKALHVTDEHGSVAEINELELIKGFIYANQWKTDLILKIDTATGRVVGRADLSTLRERTGIAAMSGRKGTPEVLNGIAYDAVNNRIFVTGKNWPKLFEIKLDN